MTASEQINQITIAVQAIVILGIIVRIVFCCVRLSHEAKDAEIYKQRIKNALVMSIIIMLAFSIYDIIAYYYKV